LLNSVVGNLLLDEGIALVVGRWDKGDGWHDESITLILPAYRVSRDIPAR